MDEADVVWVGANLVADFFNTNPYGTFIDRKASLVQIGRGSSVKNIREDDVIIRILGDLAIIHVCTSYQKVDGTQGGAVMPMISVVLAMGVGNASLSMSRAKSITQPRHGDGVYDLKHSVSDWWRAGMRGAFVDQGGLFSYIAPEARVLVNHPLRKIRELVRDALGESYW